MQEFDTVFYFYHINQIGGIETFFYQLAKQFEDRDITIIYKKADREQLKRLQKHIRTIKYREQKIKCKKAFFNYTIDIIDNVEANEYVQIVHADFHKITYKPNIHPKINRYISVSELAGKSFKELTGIECEVIYNPYKVEKAKKPLILISATRLTEDKGKGRMITLGEKLNKAEIPYLWLVFTNDKNAIENPNIVYMKPRLDILNYISGADYLVQLSDGEAYCYSMVEALTVGTPIITTNLPVLKEIGVNETNSFILEFDMSNLDVNKIYEQAKKFNFKYTPPKSEWDKEITKKKSKYKEELKMKYLVEALNTYEERKIEDGVFKRILKAGEQFEVDKERLDVLLGDNTYKVAFVKLVKEIKEELIEDKEVEKMVEETKKKPTKKKTTTKKKSVKK